jgi:hypothetical protein
VARIRFFFSYHAYNNKVIHPSRHPSPSTHTVEREPSRPWLLWIPTRSSRQSSRLPKYCFFLIQTRTVSSTSYKYHSRTKTCSQTGPRFFNAPHRQSNCRLKQVLEISLLNTRRPSLHRWWPSLSGRFVDALRLDCSAIYALFHALRRKLNHQHFLGISSFLIRRGSLADRCSAASLSLYVLIRDFGFSPLGLFCRWDLFSHSISAGVQNWRLTTSEDASNPFLSLLRPIRSAMPKNTNDVRSGFYEEVTADRCAQDPATRAQV